MTLHELEPFDGIQILTSELDEIEVGHLLRTNDKLKLICQDCGGRRFKVEAFIPATVEILTGEHIALTQIDYKKVIVNRVLECVHCGCDDFITITEPEV